MSKYQWTNADWLAWRTRMGYTHHDAADAVGRSLRQAMYYERGYKVNNGIKTPICIPITVVKAAKLAELELNGLV